MNNTLATGGRSMVLTNATKQSKVRNLYAFGTTWAVYLDILLPRFVSVSNAYHRFRFQLAHDAVFNGEFESKLLFVFDNGRTAHLHHLNKLVAHGDIDHATFVFPQILEDAASPSQLVCELCRGNGPPSLYFDFEETFGTKPFVLDVWCEQSDSATWLTYLKTFDMLVKKDR